MKAATIFTAGVLALGSLSIIAAQGGLPAPRNLRILALEETSSPVAPPCAMPAAGGGPHAYFDDLVRRPEHLCNWSLRSQAQLDSLTADKRSMFFTYDPRGDQYSSPQDAAKFFRPPAEDGAASIPGKQRLMIQLPRVESGSLIITWDWYWGPEFRYNHGNVTHWKAFHVMIGGHAWWTLMNNLSPSTLSPDPEVSKVTDEIGTGVLAEGMVESERVTPSGPGTPSQRPTYTGAYPQYHSRWTRYWIEIRLLQPPSAFTDWSSSYLGGAPLGPNRGEPEGRWHMVSLWSADENRNVQRILYRVPLNWGSERPRRTVPYPSRFDFEMNSSKRGLAGPLVGYARNVVLLHNYRLAPTNPESDSFFFQRPRR